MEITTNKRKFFQWCGYLVIMLTLLLSLVLQLPSIDPNISENTIDVVKWTGVVLGLILTLVSFLFPNKKKKKKKMV